MTGHRLPPPVGTGPPDAYLTAGSALGATPPPTSPSLARTIAIGVAIVIGLAVIGVVLGQWAGGP